MKWTLAFLAAAIAVVYFGMSYISDLQVNASENSEPRPSSQHIDVPLGAPPTTNGPTEAPVEFVSGCIESADSCRCIDKEGRPLDLTLEDCRGVLQVSPH